MDILVSHWHCIVPAIVILLAVVCLQCKDSDRTKNNRENIYKGDDTDEEIK